MTWQDTKLQGCWVKTDIEHQPGIGDCILYLHCHGHHHHVIRGLSIIIIILREIPRLCTGGCVVSTECDQHMMIGHHQTAGTCVLTVQYTAVHCTVHTDNVLYTPVNRPEIGCEGCTLEQPLSLPGTKHYLDNWIHIQLNIFLEKWFSDHSKARDFETGRLTIKIQEGKVFKLINIWDQINDIRTKYGPFLYCFNCSYVISFMFYLHPFVWNLVHSPILLT